LVAYLRNDPLIKNKLEEFIERQEPLYTTTINAFELYKGAYKVTQTRELAKVERLLNSFIILILDRDSVRLAGVLNSRTSPIGESDLLIASIAMVNEQTLVTRNKKHFEKISGLKIESW
jgi:tRNA(fMet)-specific endonuclease VapC